MLARERRRAPGPVLGAEGRRPQLRRRHRVRLPLRRPARPGHRPAVPVRRRRPQGADRALRDVGPRRTEERRHVRAAPARAGVLVADPRRAPRRADPLGRDSHVRRPDRRARADRRDVRGHRADLLVAAHDPARHAPARDRRRVPLRRRALLEAPVPERDHRRGDRHDDRAVRRVPGAGAQLERVHRAPAHVPVRDDRGQPHAARRAPTTPRPGSAACSARTSEPTGSTRGEGAAGRLGQGLRRGHAPRTRAGPTSTSRRSAGDDATARAVYGDEVRPSRCGQRRVRPRNVFARGLVDLRRARSQRAAVDGRRTGAA